MKVPRNAANHMLTTTWDCEFFCFGVVVLFEFSLENNCGRGLLLGLTSLKSIASRSRFSGRRNNALKPDDFASESKESQNQGRGYDPQNRRKTVP